MPVLALASFALARSAFKLRKLPKRNTLCRDRKRARCKWRLTDSHHATRLGESDRFDGFVASGELVE